jgi:hypothetical protein
MSYRYNTCEKEKIVSYFELAPEDFIRRKEINDILYNEYKKENVNGGNLLKEGDWVKGIDSGQNYIDTIKTQNLISFIRNKLKLINPEKYPNIKLSENGMSTLSVDFLTSELNRLVHYYTKVVIYEEKLPKIIEENKLIADEKAKAELEKRTRIKNFVEEEKIKIKNEKINKLIEMTNNYINEKEAIAIIINIVNNIDFRFTINIDNYILKECNSPHQAEKQRQKNNLLEDYFHYPRVYQKLFNESERDTLLVLQILNKYAYDKKIRVEDAKVIFNEYISKL